MVRFSGCNVSELLHCKGLVKIDSEVIQKERRIFLKAVLTYNSACYLIPTGI